MKFSEMQYKRIDPDTFRREYGEVISAFREAKTADEQYRLLLEHEKLTGTLSTMQSLSYIYSSVDTRDAAAEAEQNFYDEYSPVFNEMILDFYRAMLASPFRKELEEKVGKLFFTNIELELKGFTPEMIPLMQEENALCTRYQKLRASAKIPFEGKENNLSQMGAYFDNRDRSVRQAAELAVSGFYEEHKAEFDEIYDKLVKNRTAQAKLLGFDTYTPLGYIRMGRNCYTPEMVDVFRNEVVNDLVPLAVKIKERQAKRIGADKICSYDDTYRFPDGNPKPHGTADDILSNAREMYHEMSDTTAEFVDFMLDNELFDVLAKPGKDGGGYCIDIHDYKAPFVFSNFNGTEGDVTVVTHEFGHALAYYLARSMEIAENQSPTMEACEVHSMSMEFLTWPWMNKFFKEDTAKFCTSHLEDALTFIPYGCLVDEFQHIVYGNPDMTPEQRRQTWLGLEKKYRPYLHFEDAPYLRDGCRFFQQAHIFESPFYYIDYCLAQTIALQYWALSREDHPYALARYLTMTKKGGTRTYVDLVEGAGLKSPFKAGCIREVAEKALEFFEEDDK